MFQPRVYSQALECVLIKAANNPGSAHVAIPDNIYSKDVNFERALIPLQTLPDVVKAYKQSQGLTRLEVTSERTIGDGINGVLMAKEMFSEIDKCTLQYLSQYTPQKEASHVLDVSRTTSDLV